MEVTFRSGEMIEKIDIPKENLIAVLEPNQLTPNEQDENIILEKAIKNPIGCKALKELIRPGRKISIAVDDITRPTPTKRILNILIPKLLDLGIKKSDIKITIGNGLHRKTKLEEKVFLLGQEIINNFNVDDNHAQDGHNYSFLGYSSRNTPIFINKRVTNADLIITTGLIKSHAFAGYTGGAKSIVPGVAGKETIMRNHRYDHIEYPTGIMGDPDISSSRNDMEEIAKKLKIFIINVVLNSNKEIIGAFAGDVVKAHRAGIALFNKMAYKEVEEQGDVVFIEGSYGASQNFYQTIFTAGIALLTKKPIIKKGGTIILYAQCREGVGSQIFQDLVDMGIKNPEQQMLLIKNSKPLVDQWSLQHFLYFLTQCNIFIVSKGLSPIDTQKMGMEPFNSLNNAFEEAKKIYGKKLKVIVVKSPDFLVPVIRENS